jgi:Protein of unknown function (DUF3014)
MFNVDDVELDRSFDEPFEPYPPPRPARIGWVIGVVIGFAVAGGIAYSVLRPRPTPAPPIAAPAPPPPAVEQPKVVEAPALVGDNISLPPLTESDGLMRELVGRLSSHPTIAAWLATKGLIANFAVVTLNISEGHMPSTHLRALSPKGRFLTQGSRTALTVDPRSYDRYNPVTESVSGLDATGTARLYLTIKPRVQDAYKDLGYPDGDFDRVLEQAIGHLLKAPIVDGSVALRQKTLSFGFADPQLESLSPVQKQFMRMGPRNEAAVQAKLREIASLLNLRTD